MNFGRPAEVDDAASASTYARRVYVGNISWATTEESLGSSLGVVGPVQEVKIIIDKETGRSKGFGFVTFISESYARLAIEKLNGIDVDGRPLKISSAQPHGTQSFGRGGRGGGRRGGGVGGYYGGPYGQGGEGFDTFAAGGRGGGAGGYTRGPRGGNNYMMGAQQGVFQDIPTPYGYPGGGGQGYYDGAGGAISPNAYPNGYGAIYGGEGGVGGFGGAGSDYQGSGGGYPPSGWGAQRGGRGGSYAGNFRGGGAAGGGRGGYYSSPTSVYAGGGAAYGNSRAASTPALGKRPSYQQQDGMGKNVGSSAPYYQEIATSDSFPHASAQAAQQQNGGAVSGISDASAVGSGAVPGFSGLLSQIAGGAHLNGYIPQQQQAGSGGSGTPRVDVSATAPSQQQQQATYY